MLRWLVIFAALAALSGAWGSAAFGQTTSPAGSSAGAFDSLSPGGQKIARALYEAQPTGSGATTPPLTLDQIAAKKQSGQGWGNVFKDMKAQGLVQDKNLGQVVSRSHRAANGSTYTASGRPYSYGRHEGKHAYSEQGENEVNHGRYEHGSSGRGQTYASGPGAAKSGGSGGGVGHSGRGGK